MKKYKHLFDKIATYNNFKEAFKKASKGKAHYKEVKIIKRNLNRVLYNLYRHVKNGTYKVGGYKIFDLYTGNKWRTIYKLSMRDRIVQHAIMNVIEPIFRESFIPDTFQSIKGRGIHLCLKRVKQAIKDKENTICYAKLDIHKCYPSLDQNILKQKLAKKFTDKKLLALLYVIIDSCDKGVPIGNYTSQYFNNFYFNDLDHYAKEVLKIKYYFRYCDDIVIFGKTKEEVEYNIEKLKEYIATLNVELKPNIIIYELDVHALDFVGYLISREVVKVRKRIKLKFIAKCKAMDFNNLSKRDINILGSYYGILIHADCRNLWYKYTEVKEFKDLQVKVHNRTYIRNILDEEIIVKDCQFYSRRGETRVKLLIDTTTDKDLYVSTSGEMIIEAAKQFRKNHFPFKTKITTNEQTGYYQFV